MSYTGNMDCGSCLCRRISWGGDLGVGFRVNGRFVFSRVYALG